MSDVSASNARVGVTPRRERASAMLGHTAGPISRAIADVVDVVLAIVVTVIVWLGAALVRFVIAPLRFEWPTPGIVSLAVIAWIVLVVYLAIAWSGTGRSVGKQLMGLRVQMRDGAPLAGGRALARAITCAAFPLGLLSSFFNRDNASLQDVVLRTTVVYDWRPKVPR
jgi:uncharacterized RDD family membrane protein YckC